MNRFFSKVDDISYAFEIFYRTLHINVFTQRTCRMHWPLSSRIKRNNSKKCSRHLTILKNYLEGSKRGNNTYYSLSVYLTIAKYSNFDLKKILCLCLV